MPLAYITLPSSVPFLLVAYVTVLLAELVGDKSLFTIAALGLKFRVSPVFVGFAFAFMGKMLAAVLFGKLLLGAPQRWIDLLSALGFFACALIIWFREPPGASLKGTVDPRWLPAATIAFSSIFFTEWCDTGQLAAAALAAHTQALVSVWLGGTLALITKGTLALTFGAKLSSMVPSRLIRTLACASYCVLGFISLSQLRLHGS